MDGTPRTAPASDRRILTAHASGQRDAALAALIEQHALSLGRLCMALLGSQTEAEDALQETLLAADQGLASFRGDGSLRAWLFAIARRRCAQRLEARRREERNARAALEASDDDDAPDAERVAQASRARALLDRVKPSEREALLLRYGAELSFREVAEACGIDEAAARKRVSRGLGRLRELWSEK